MLSQGLGLVSNNSKHAKIGTPEKTGSWGALAVWSGSTLFAQTYPAKTDT